MTYEYASVDHCTGHHSNETKWQAHAIDGVKCNIQSSLCSLRHHDGYTGGDALRLRVAEIALLFWVLCINICMRILILKELLVLLAFVVVH